MLVPFTWKVTGWFMVGWSPEFRVGEVRPLHYFGEDLVPYSIWWPRIPGDDSDVPHGKLREVIEKQFLSAVFDDLQIWRYQKYVEHPARSTVDAKGYMALRKWATQFYEVPA